MRRNAIPWAIGHRGAPALAEENTLASFRAALDAGLDGIEIDVHRTRDGVLAVHHDPHTSDGIELKASDWSDLHARHPKIPRLEEVFELLESYSQRWLNVELKALPGGSDGRESALVDALAAWSSEAAERVWISCFSPESLAELQRLGSGAPLALLMGERSVDVLSEVPDLRVAGLHVERRLATHERIERWHAEGMFVFAWTVNELGDARRLVDSGIDGLIGDHPHRLLEAIRRES